MTTLDYIVGTRPEATKGWLLLGHLAKTCTAEISVLYSGQHVGLLDRVIEDLAPVKRTTPVWLSRTEPGASFDWRKNFEEKLRYRWNPSADTRPEAVCIIGDTDTARIAAEQAAIAGIPLIQVEAGIRHRGEYLEQEPEEINRRKISKLATLHFTPTQREAENLVFEKISARAIHVVGDLSSCSIASAWSAHIRKIASGSAAVDVINLNHRPYVLCTFHRSTSLTFQTHLFKSFLDAVRTFAELDFVLLERPDTRWDQFYRQLGTIQNVRVVPSLVPSEFLATLLQADFVMTDSAGVQQESLLLKKATIACRREIELYADTPGLHLVEPPFSNLKEVVGVCSYESQGDRPESTGVLSPVLSDAMATATEISTHIDQFLHNTD